MKSCLISGLLISICGRTITGRCVTGASARRNRLPLTLTCPTERRGDEVLVSEAFALAHNFQPGDHFAALINGRYRRLTIAGIALSPEYIYSIRPGDILPDNKRFGVLWMERKVLATAFQMEGGFNDVALKLAASASEKEVIAQLDRLLAPYGATGAIPRSLQFSNWSIDNELRGLRVGGTIIPSIFFAVAAFLLNMVLTRIIALQRGQIGMLKALGYTDREIGVHYLKWSLAIAVVGTALGVSVGAWLGSGMASLYTEFFRFPILEYRLSSHLVAFAVLVGLATAVTGAFHGVRQAARLPPAVAMRPEAPAAYRPSLPERLGLTRFLTEPVRMILRDLERRPVRAMLSILGIAMAAALLIVGRFFLDAIEVVMDHQFNVVQRQDLTITFAEPVSSRAMHEISRLPGVLFAEPLRMVPARLRFGHRTRQLAIQGLRREARLQRVVHPTAGPLEMPSAGLVVSAKLAELLGVAPGDTVTVEVLEGTRPVRRIAVARIVEEYLGITAYMEATALHRLMREDRVLTGGVLQVDEKRLPELYRRFKATPAVAGVSLKRAAIESFRKTIAQNMGLMIFFNVLFSVVIAFGVVYNAARVLLSERSRELATLRVVGFTRREISSILLGELAFLVVAALPVGMLVGYGLAGWAVWAFDTEFYRFPLVISAKTYAFSIFIVLVSAVLSGLVAHRMLDRLDLVGALKAPE